MNTSTIKQAIKHSFWGRYFISELHCIESWLLPKLVSDETAVKRLYKKKTGKELPLDNPQTFSEKLNWYKLNGRIPLMQKCADKVGIREYIKACGYEEGLNEVYGIYSKAKDIDIDTLPERFVLKAAHGSHMNLIVKDKSQVNWKKERRMINSWLHQNIAWSGREWVYAKMPKRIIVEKYLEDATGELRDYKFFCFNGVPHYMQVDIGRYAGVHYRNYYDMEMNLIPVSDDCPRNDEVKTPLDESHFDTMKEMAAKLSKPFQHVRVDFYCVNGKIYIGEMTFFHNGGFTWFEPEHYDLEFGSKWNLVR